MVYDYNGGEFIRETLPEKPMGVIGDFKGGMPKGFNGGMPGQK